ncbi:ATPase H(+)-transporting accessory protein 2 isoform X3 [Anoplolepis gracilipes]|uniref:ATPase H(+)-transporting accessory protein 2 isoform X3 n=1 Tax=Anoplolepis gracilipes TaxID=354296 RepID=UPI003B9DDE78
MFRQLSLLFAILATVYASGELRILHCPDSVEFTLSGKIEQSCLKEILSATLGFTGKQRDVDHNIAIWDPFSIPQVLVVIVCDGIKMLSSNEKNKVSLIVDEMEEATWQAIRSRVEERSNDNTLVRINLSDGVDALGQSALGELKPANIEELKFLKPNVEEDRKFVEEMQLLHAIAENAKKQKPKEKPIVYWLVVSGLKPLQDLHGNTSVETKEAYMLLNDGMEHVSKSFVNTYDGQVIVLAFTNDPSQVRTARSVLLERQRRDALPEFSGRAKTYSEDYPVIFNILLWFGVIFFFSLLAICIAIADMDPGRDSIIYRMTSNRMKKDN